MEPQKDEIAEKNILAMMIKISQFNEKYKLIDPRSSTNQIRRNKNNISRHIIIKLLETSDKETILKASRRKKKNFIWKGTDLKITIYSLLYFMQVEDNGIAS